MPTVAIIDDHELVRSGLRHMLVRELDVEVVHEGCDPMVLLVTQPPPDLILLDLDLGERRADPAVAGALQARGSYVLIVSAFATPEAIVPMLEAGVSGFVSKHESQQVLLDAIAVTLRGEQWVSPEVAAIIVSAPERPRLSPSQERVLVLYASGMTLESVARHLGLSYGTAQTHLKRARAKYAEAGRAMPGRVDVYREVMRDGLIND